MDALRALPEYRSAAAAALADPPQFQVLPATDYLRALRPQHWLKNLLTFVPLFAAHLLLQPLALERTLALFLAFCCCASSGYLFNDLCDLSADRRHPRRRLRPFASGRPPLAYGWVAAPSLAILGCALAWMVSGLALGIVLLSLSVSLAYSLSFKKIEVLDVVVLASLYTLRIVGGVAAIELWPTIWLFAFSIWLFAFSMLLFISLALVKRYAELMTMRGVDGERARACGYELSDAELPLLHRHHERLRRGARSRALHRDGRRPDALFEAPAHVAGVPVAPLLDRVSVAQGSPWEDARRPARLRTAGSSQPYRAAADARCRRSRHLTDSRSRGLESRQEGGPRCGLTTEQICCNASERARVHPYKPQWVGALGLPRIIGLMDIDGPTDTEGC